jgi:CheY-like chemotaxis protein
VRQEPLILVFTTNPLAPKFIGQCIDRYEVVASTQLSQSAALVERYYPRAILVDRALDEELSIALLPYPLPVIYFSLPNDPHMASKLPRSISNYLVKPVSRQTLLDAIGQLGPQIHIILVVDDDPAMVRFVAQALKEKDPPGGEQAYQVKTAISGGEALQQMAAEPVDAVLMDLSLPDMDGWQVLAEMRKQDNLQPIPVIIMSATDLPQALFSSGLNVLDVVWNRPLTQGELTNLLPVMLETLQPFYPPTNGAPPHT